MAGIQRRTVLQWLAGLPVMGGLASAQSGLPTAASAKVGFAPIVDTARAASDSFFRAAAESALRAVKNPNCSPLKVPLDKYDEWKTMTLTFNPKDLL